MSKPKLSYFDAPVSRGEECRLALTVAKVDFEDNRLNREQWAAMKPSTPFGAVPTFEIDGKMFAQSNAILTFIGRKWGLHPKDEVEAARHEAMMCHVEDLRHAVGPTLRMTDEAEKKAAREALASTTMPKWAEAAESQIADDGPFFGGSQINVVDFKIHMILRWFLGGKVDHIPADVFAKFPKLNRVHDAVRDHAEVKAWYASK